MSDFGPWERTEGLDDYEPGHGLIGQPRGCTFCGSMHPDDFMDAVRAGLTIGVTSKSYKLYVHGIPRKGDPDEPRVLSHSTHQFSGSRPWRELTRAEKKAAKAYGSTISGSPKTEFWQFTRWGDTVDGKFYTAHLSEEQGWEFDQLWREGKVNFDYRPPRLFIPGPSTQRSES
jgi:hypothetical protein